jgi:peptidoglycan biosynthesis protein MviN/MurJ (putative lipid II flippase)
MLILRSRLNGINGGRLGSVLVRQGVASIVMAAAAWIVERQLHVSLPGHDLFSQIVRVGVSIGVALAVLVAAARLFGVSELNELVDGVARRLRRKPIPPQV